MSSLNLKTVETPVRLANSKLWDIQREYFNSRGVAAWEKEVPFYISSNMFIAERYAMQMIRVIQDWLAWQPALAQSTFYFLELGCGTGKFTYYFLNSFERLLKQYHLSELDYCYIASDVSRKNVDFCRDNKSLAQYVQAQKLDFSYYDVVEDQDIYLLNKQRHYRAIAPDTPMMVIANYTFDCIETDILRFSKEKKEEWKIGLTSRYKNFDINSCHLDDLRLLYQAESIELTNYFSDPTLDEAVNEFYGKYNERNIFFPVPTGGIRFIKNLNAITQQKFVLITGDKGIGNEFQFTSMSEKHLVSFDGCFSFLVNFPLIKDYIARLGGGGLLQVNNSDFKVNLFYQGIPEMALRHTQEEYTNLFSSFGPEEYCTIYKEYLSNAYRFDFSSLLAFVKLSHFDPDAYTLIHEKLLEYLPNLEPLLQNELNRVLEKVVENIYLIPMGDDMSNLTGIIYYLQGQYDRALPLFEQSIQLFGKKSSAYHNIGLVYEKMNKPDLAAKYFEKAYECDRKDKLAKYRADKLSGKLTFRWFMPVLKVLGLVSVFAAGFYYLNR